jgi:addiction module RelE/StbE family toxin
LIQLKWSAFALADRTSIFDYIEADNPRAAASIDERIRTRVMGLAQFPEMGRAGRIEGTRELVISGTPYIAAYRVDGETIRILRVLHGAQRWPEEIAEEPEERP